MMSRFRERADSRTAKLLALLLFVLTGAGGATAAPPNVVVILADDLGYGDLGSYGHSSIRTPHLDRMAAEGMRFTQFYSVGVVCSPTRAALITGRYPVRSGITRALGPDATGGLPDDELTIAEAVKTAGYATACIGKWHLGHLPPYLPKQHGFEEYFGLPYSNDMTVIVNPHLFPEAPELPLLRGDDVIERSPDLNRLTERYTEEAVEFIAQRAADGKPFFLYLPHTFPHVPLFAGERFRRKSARGLYGDVVEELDWSVGEVLRAIKEHGLDDNTLVMFTSDNGPWLAQKLNGGSAGPFREGKTSTWEGGVRVPFIARWPGRIPAGKTSLEVSSVMDLLPTVAALAGVELPRSRELDGRDLSGALFREERRSEQPVFFYSRERLSAVRKGPWKLYVETTTPSKNSNAPTKHDPPLLYNVLKDPAETYNVASASPGVVAELLELLREHARTVEPGPRQK